MTFQGGQGFDGLVQATALAALSRTIGVCTAVYLLPLRHPLPVARQVASLAQLAPGRFTFGVGVGGEDRHEVESCGVDPATRGRRTDESLRLIRRLFAGETVTATDGFFPVDEVRILPTPDPPGAGDRRRPLARGVAPRRPAVGGMAGVVGDARAVP